MPRTYAILDPATGQVPEEMIPPSGQGAAGPHAADHATAGTDEVTPTAIGAASSSALTVHEGTAHGTSAHAISGVMHSGTLDHSALANQTANQHHNQAHAVSGADHTGTLAIGQIPTGTTSSTVAIGDHTHPGGGASTWTTVIKTADESKNNLAVVADDALLKFTTVANTNYVVRLKAWFLTNATADLKYRLFHTGTTTRVRRRVYRTATTDIAQTVELKTAFDVADVVLSTTGLNPWLEEYLVLQVGASGGQVVLRWAQVTSNAGPTTCLEGSYLEYAVT